MALLLRGGRAVLGSLLEFPRGIAFSSPAAGVHRGFTAGIACMFPPFLETPSPEVQCFMSTMKWIRKKTVLFVQELVEQQKLITKMKRQIEEKEKSCASHLHKVSQQ